MRLFLLHREKKNYETAKERAVIAEGEGESQIRRNKESVDHFYIYSLYVPVSRIFLHVECFWLSQILITRTLKRILHSVAAGQRHFISSTLATVF
jgi:hypothetical protein